MKDVNVPAGYKNTDIGVIPEDWKEYYLTELGILERGKSKHRPRWAEHLYGGNYPFIQTGEITAANKYVTNYNKTYSEAGLAQSKLWSKGTLCITIAANIAETAILKIPACFPDSILGFVPISKKANVEFVFYTINYLQERIKELVISSAQDNINLGTFQKIKFPLPPTIEEQKAIARVLSDVDELIRECDSLLAKKRDIKQGTMQQLLTSKKRLPGFSGEWEEKKLGDVLKVKHGKSQHHIIDENGEYPILATGGQIGSTNTFLYDKPSVLIGRKGTIDVPQYTDKPFWTIDTLFYTEIYSKAVPKFIFYKFNLINWYSYNEASGVPSLNAYTIENIDDYFPPTLSEQKAIAEILSDMDAEIESLEQKRDKYKAIKQGMMQELLTGKTRLIKN